MTSADGASDLPVTTSAREPMCLARSPTVILAPAPNTISVAVANANCTALPAACVSRDLGVDDADSRFRHQRRDGVAPGEVVGCGLVRDGSLRVAIHLEKHEPRGVVALPQDVEARDARLEPALACVVLGGCLKRGDGVWSHVHA